MLSVSRTSKQSERRGKTGTGSRRPFLRAGRGARLLPRWVLAH